MTSAMLSIAGVLIGFAINVLIFAVPFDIAAFYAVGMAVGMLTERFFSPIYATKDRPHD